MGELVKSQQTSAGAEEDRILRRWTPVLLRSIVIAAMTVLIAGLALTATFAPNYFVGRYRQIQLGHLLSRESLAGIWSNLVAGKPHAVLTVGLYLLTLVPLARVAFCLVLFIKTRDIAYVGFTAYVFAALIIGFLLGHVG